MIYTAQSQSLAVLEVLVHLDSSELLKKYVLFEVEIDVFLRARACFIELAEELEGETPPPSE